MTTAAPPVLKANWGFPTSVRFGPGRIAELADACRAVGIGKPLLVTDPGLADLPIVRNAVAALEAAGLTCAVFSAIKPNPVERNVIDGVELYRSGGHDGVIAFGGGSGLDAGKAIAFMAGQTRPIWDFEDIGDWWTRADPVGIAPIIAVPTTAGTGSEVGRAAVITNDVTHEKKIIFHPKMLPAIVISDPELTVGLPAKVTAATGTDALAHCLEAYCAPGFHPMADGIALEGLRLVHDYLPRAVADGTDITARAALMAAASMGAAAFQKGLGAVHALSHPLGARYDAHHGLLNGILMPYVLVFNRAEIEDRMDRLARLLNLPTPGFDGVLEWLLALRKDIGIPHTLAEIGMTEEDAAAVAADGIKDPSAGGNPVPLTEESLATLYRDAIAGRL